MEVYLIWELILGAKSFGQEINFDRFPSSAIILIQSEIATIIITGCTNNSKRMKSVLGLLDGNTPASISLVRIYLFLKTEW